MIITAMNVKGLTNPKKVKKIKKWKQNIENSNILVLTKVKVSGVDLQERLQAIDTNLIWINSCHEQGSGGVAMGIHSKWGPNIKGTILDQENKCVAFVMEEISIIAIYATGPQGQRAAIWESIRMKFDDPAILVEDFNMVECHQDRYQKRGQIIAGVEKREWLALKNHLNLIDVGNTGEFLWQNYGEGPSLRKARLDRCYISQEMGERFIHIECKVS